MTQEGIHAFASYFLSQKDRGLEPGTSSTYGFLDGNISKFGVGATQAGFYLGETIKVSTKTKNSPMVAEIAISRNKLHERAKLGLPVFEDAKRLRNPGDTSDLDANEQKYVLFFLCYVMINFIVHIFLRGNLWIILEIAQIYYSFVIRRKFFFI